MLIRLVLIVLVVGAVGVFTGKIEPKELLSRVPTVPSVRPDAKVEYLRLVDRSFARLQFTSEGFFGNCMPGPKTRATCTVMADQMIKGLRALQERLERAEAPASLARVDAALRRFLARGIEGFTLVQRAARTGKRRDWVRARNVVDEAGALLERVALQLSAVSLR